MDISYAAAVMFRSLSVAVLKGPGMEIIKSNNKALFAIFNMQAHFMLNRNAFWG